MTDEYECFAGVKWVVYGVRNLNGVRYEYCSRNSLSMFQALFRAETYLPTGTKCVASESMRFHFSGGAALSRYETGRRVSCYWEKKGITILRPVIEDRIR